MKILMPFLVHNDVSIHDDKVMGGVELFAQLLYRNIPGIIPVEITKEDRRKGRAKHIIDFAVWEHKPDAIIINYDTDTYTTKLLKYKIPVIWIWHSQADGSMGRIKSMRYMEEFTAGGGIVYFVSEHQHRVFDKVSQRATGHEVRDVSGYVRPAFTEKLAVNPLITWDATTVGRNEAIKNPFWVHNKLDGSDLTSAVVTTLGQHLKSPIQQKYNTDNLNWQPPRTVFRGLSHADCMDKMSQGRVFVSTCPSETFGISALEALARGLPVLMVTDKSDSHASQCLVDSEKDYRLIQKGAKPEEVQSVIREMASETMEDRIDRANRIQKKHSKENWIRDWIEVFQRAISARL